MMMRVIANTRAVGTAEGHSIRVHFGNGSTVRTVYGVSSEVRHLTSLLVSIYEHI